MSHELRTPLNSLLVLARTLAQNAAGNLTATQLGGEVTVQSELDKGSTFSPYLPLEAQVQAGAGMPPAGGTSEHPDSGGADLALAPGAH